MLDYDSKFSFHSASYLEYKKCTTPTPISLWNVKLTHKRIKASLNSVLHYYLVVHKNEQQHIISHLKNSICNSVHICVEMYHFQLYFGLSLNIHRCRFGKQRYSWIPSLLLLAVNWPPSEALRYFGGGCRREAVTRFQAGTYLSIFILWKDFSFLFLITAPSWV